MIRESLLSKLLLLTKILLAKYQIIKLIWVAKSFELNDFARDKFNEVEWCELFGVKYKKIADGTGEYRFFIPSISNNLAWRVDEKYSVSQKNKVPATLEFIVLRDGLRDEKRYKEVWEQGKSFK